MGQGDSKRKKRHRRPRKRRLAWLRRRHRKTQDRMERHKKLLENEIKILVLGTGDSGKSTFIKQIQVLYKNGFSDTEKRLYTNVIRFNLVAHIKALINACDELDIRLDTHNVEIAEDFVEEAEVERGVLPEDIVEDIITLWNDKALKEAYERRAEFQLPDSANYFLDDIVRISKEDYIPSDEDILRCRIATAGVKSMTFQMGEIPWRIVDVGGQRSERRKWIHQFEDVTLVIYVVAMSEYDQRLFEDESVNRMKESISVFEETLNNKYFKRKNCVILFNKMDIFEEKITKINLNVCFDSYTGGLNPSEASEFIKEQFYKVGNIGKRQIFSNFVCGIRTGDIEAVFDTVQKAVQN